LKRYVVMYGDPRIARFYFHLQEAGKLQTDTEGTDLPDVEAAKQEALLAAQEASRFSSLPVSGTSGTALHLALA
jgi:hypothetical protein